MQTEQSVVKLNQRAKCKVWTFWLHCNDHFHKTNIWLPTTGLMWDCCWIHLWIPFFRHGTHFPSTQWWRASTSEIQTKSVGIETIFYSNQASFRTNDTDVSSQTWRRYPDSQMSKLWVKKEAASCPDFVPLLSHIFLVQVQGPRSVIVIYAFQHSSSSDFWAWKGFSEGRDLPLINRE